MQAGPEVGNGFEERDVARVERTSGPGTAQIIHIYLYVVRRLQDTRGCRTVGVFLFSKPYQYRNQSGPF